jgi:D-alanyl-D-alanine carboxypeptidase
VLWVVTVATLGVATLAAQTQAVDTASGRELSRWLAVFNGLDREARQAFYRERWAYRPNQAFYEDLREQTGGFEVLRVEESTAARTVAIAKQVDSDAVSRITFEIEPAEPYRIVRFAAPTIPRPADLPIARVSEAELVTMLRASLDRWAAADRFAGAVLVARNGTPVFTAAYGLADRERSVANTVETRFKNGSMNKMFTAAATLLLVREGRLALEDTLGKHLTDYPNKAVASTVTIHQLLTHTGGTGDIFGPEFTAHRLELRTPQDYVTLLGKRDVLFEPGSQWMYSNYGFALLGAIIEKVSGRSYYDFVHDRIFAPAGMSATGSEPEDQVLPNTAIGYMRRGGTNGWQPNTATLAHRGMSAGGGYTTVGDLLRFATALTNHRLLDAKFTAMLTTGKVATPGGKYAYGFVETASGGVRTFGHSGGAPGQSGDLIVLPESGYVVAVLSNIDPPAAPRVSNYIAARLPLK